MDADPPAQGVKIACRMTNTNLESLSAVQELKVELRCPHCARRHRFPINSGHLAYAARSHGFASLCERL